MCFELAFCVFDPAAMTRSIEIDLFLHVKKASIYKAYKNADYGKVIKRWDCWQLAKEKKVV